MKKLVLIVAAMLAFNYAAGEKSITYDKDGNIIVTTTSKKVAPVQTGHTLTLENDSTVVYRVYINPESGRCFITRVSKRTGNEYKDYNIIPKDTQRKYAQEMGIVYKESKPKKQ